MHGVIEKGKKRKDNRDAGSSRFLSRILLITGLPTYPPCFDAHVMCPITPE